MHQPIPEKTFRAFKRGDETAFREIYDACHDDIDFIAHSFVEQTDAADDIVSETFQELWVYHRVIRKAKNIRSFLFTVTKNACLDFLKHDRIVKRKEAEIREMLESPEPIPEVADWTRHKLLENIYEAIEVLPPQCRTVCQLAFIDGLKNGDIAMRLLLSEKTVRNQKVIGLQRLRFQFTKPD